MVAQTSVLRIYSGTNPCRIFIGAARLSCDKSRRIFGTGRYW